jgi:hypothetical protein
MAPTPTGGTTVGRGTRVRYPLKVALPETGTAAGASPDAGATATTVDLITLRGEGRSAS